MFKIVFAHLGVVKQWPKNHFFFFLVYINFFLLFTLTNIVLLGLWTINYSLFFGYAIGALLSLIMFEINRLSLMMILLRAKKGAIILGILKFLINIIIVSVILIIIIYINRNYADKNKILGIAYNKPINIIAFSLGISSIVPAIVISMLVENILKKKKRGGLNESN